MMEKENKERVFHIYLPHTLIQVLRVKMVQDKKIKTPMPMGQLNFVGAIVGLSKEKGYCWAKQKELSRLTTLSSRTIEDYLTKLCNQNILYRYYHDGERRIRVSDYLIELYPEIEKDLEIERVKKTPRTHVMEDRKNTEHRGNDTEHRGNDTEIPSEHPDNCVRPYYIYKYKEIELKRKLNILDTDFLFSFSDLELEDFIKKQNPNSKKSDLANEAFEIISSFYPVKNNITMAKEPFLQLDDNELKVLFETMGAFIDECKIKQEENFKNNQPRNKYIVHFKKYIEEKRFLEYEKNISNGAGVLVDSIELFIQRVKGYATDYQFHRENILINPLDLTKDRKWLFIIIKAVYEMGLTEDVLTHCKAIFNRYNKEKRVA